MNAVVHEHPVTGAEYPHTALSGCGSSGKTDFVAVYGLVNWMCAPLDTLVLATSTDLKASRKRIWGSIVQYFQPLTHSMPGKLVDSQGIIRTDDGSGVFTDKNGIALIAGEKKKERDAIGKIIGAKNKRVFLLADELCELTPSIMEAAWSNLTTNPFFQVVACANFKSRYDPFGEFAEPKQGYDSINVETLEWETVRGGYCLRFDGLKSPNILSGVDEYPIYGSKQLAAQRKNMGENTASFWRMCRSFEAPIGVDNVLYSDSELAVGAGMAEPIWRGEVKSLAAYDPSWTNGGDRFVLWTGKLGVDGRTGRNTLYFDQFHVLFENVLKAKERTRAFQMADQVIDICNKYGVESRNLGGDVTAGGGSQADVIEEVWGKKIHRVDFSGSATERTVSTNNPKTAKEMYWNRVSELWGVGAEFLKYGQLKGIKPEQAREMKARKYETIKGADGLKIKVEKKEDMKERVGFSPDIADSAFVLIDVARRLGFTAGGSGSTSQSANSFKTLAIQFNQVYTNVKYAA